MTIKEIEKQEQKNLKTYFNVGYDIFLFNRNLSTIYILKTKN
jgi:predicted GNAT superfamily acetyltransferase